MILTIMTKIISRTARKNDQLKLRKDKKAVSQEAEIKEIKKYLNTQYRVVHLYSGHYVVSSHVNVTM